MAASTAADLIAIYAKAKMRIDPKGVVAGYPALQVRRALKQLDLLPEWDLRRFEAATGEGRAFVRALVAAGLVERVEKGYWSITQAGKTLSSATAAPRVTRATAEKNLAAFLGRVDHVNRSARFLGKVVTVVLFGSMLRPEVDRVSDVDLAVEITPKEPDKDRARALNERDVQVAGAAFSRLPRPAALLAPGGLPLSKGAKSRDLPSGSQGRGRVRDDRAAPDPLCKRCLDGGRTTTNQGPPSPAASVGG